MARIQIDYPTNTLFECELPVRITDINYGQHLAHDKLISMLHEARAQFFIAFDMAENDVDGAGIILSDLAIRYQAEAFHPQTLRFEIALGDPTKRGCDMLYRVTDKTSGQAVATAKTGLVFFDYDQKKVASMPERFAKLLEK